MNETELKLLWQSANEQIAHCISINKEHTSEIIKWKAQNLLSSMKPAKTITLIVGVIWVLVLGSFLANLWQNHYDQTSVYFLYSATLQVVLTAATVLVYIYQLYTLNQLDFTKPVLTIQENLSLIKISTLNVTRLLILQLPLWTTFYLNDKMFVSGNELWWLLQAVITLSFTVLAVWLFLNIKYTNRNKKWFQFLFQGKEWQPLMQAMELLNEIEQFQNSHETK